MINSIADRNHRSQSVLKAVVLYGDYESGIKAKALLHRATSRAGWPETMQSLFWRLDVMSQPEVAREALYQAADAEMVLLVPKTMSRAPEWLLEWIEIWAMTRRFSDAILAAWCEHHDSPGATESIRTLRELANRQGLGFLCADDLPQQAA